MKLDILSIGVHPDDVELSCSGTLLRHIKKGKTVGLLDLTKGELGTRGSAALRTEEAMTAAQMMGAKVREQLDLADGFFTQNEADLRKIIRVIRRYQPEIVLCNSVEDRHPDHGRAAKMTADACFLSGLRRVETVENDGTPQAPWRPKVVYHYIQDRALKPDFVVDISDFVERKFDLIMAYKSQFFDPLSNEPATPISGQSFLDSIRGKDAVYGRYIGVPYAEGFIASRTVGVKDLFDLM
ncbi:MAG: bacillithiol biosynthesis deacetylase BshB1 [Saprospiraceae bacterium]|nr:bacillithiol biosynthesis deacetylase BshB1 [Saprospiraceae bacterium]